MMVDTATVTIKAGDGGHGASTFLRNAMTSRGGPDGGNGGNGGSIYIAPSNNITDLKEFRYKKKIFAANGIAGQNQKKHGKNAENTTIFVPHGTRITDTETGEIFEVTPRSKPFVIAKAGVGGRGNTEFKTAINQAPLYGEKGGEGQKRVLLFELRLIAEVGLIGLPNAGKSTLLTKLTQARPRIGDYPFTTLEPTIGMMGVHAIADIPGLIEGASTGRGLGTKFLRHIEKTKVFVHLIELTQNDVLQAYETIRGELKNHNPELLEKPEIVLLTKKDLVDEKYIKERVALFKKQKKQVLTYAQNDAESIDRLKEALLKLLT